MMGVERKSSKTRFWVGCLIYHKSTGRFGVVVSYDRSICKIVYADDGRDNQTPITVLGVDLEYGYCCTRCQGLKREHELAPNQNCLCAACAQGQTTEADQKTKPAVYQKFDPVAPLIW
jgi:hypothetical protein